MDFATLNGKSSRLALGEQCQRSCLLNWVQQVFLSKHWLTVELAVSNSTFKEADFSQVLHARSSLPTPLQQLEICASEHPRGTNSTARATRPFKRTDSQHLFAEAIPLPQNRTNFVAESHL